MRLFNLILLFILSTGVVLADDKALDVTIKVLESSGDSPSNVTKTIQLPTAAQKAREQASAGRESMSNDNTDRSLDERQRMSNELDERQRMRKELDQRQKMRNDDRKTATKQKARVDQKEKNMKKKKGS